MSDEVNQKEIGGRGQETLPLSMSMRKPSGIYATTSDYWFHRLELKEKEFCTLVFKTDILKKIVDSYKDKITKNVGDNKASKCVLIPIKEIFRKEFYDNV